MSNLFNYLGFSGTSQKIISDLEEKNNAMCKRMEALEKMLM